MDEPTGTTVAHTTRDVAALIGASEWWVRQQVRAGRFPHYRVGRGAIRFTPAHMDTILGILEDAHTAERGGKQRRPRPTSGVA